MTRTRIPSQTFKLIISTASIAATLTGWALLAIQNPPAATATESFSQAPAVVAPPPAWLSEPPVIPTLPPLIAVAQPPESADIQPVAPAAGSAQPVAPAAPAPVVVANPPVLREVSAPLRVNPPVQAQRPAPVVVTRSSR
ncbi:hypothetical protein [Roseiflexus castenholzii]|uniref:Uncharacterized protein n=1 Tax=Roseiflexus castenholzii (strain DSM 13941 / HLO8) TaxID=383372 RepID=A7NFX6_ROSCS|nr:hypothetical protein [Roseiflexus castenholzii]ABU56360.1 conserved hypothetical protein [Roseiflexus castenholzii DSM 13941]